MASSLTNTEPNFEGTSFTHNEPNTILPSIHSTVPSLEVTVSGPNVESTALTYNEPSPIAPTSVSKEPSLEVVTLPPNTTYLVQPDSQTDDSTTPMATTEKPTTIKVSDEAAVDPSPSSEASISRKTQPYL